MCMLRSTLSLHFGLYTVCEWFKILPKMGDWLRDAYNVKGNKMWIYVSMRANLIRREM